MVCPTQGNLSWHETGRNIQLPSLKLQLRRYSSHSFTHGRTTNETDKMSTNKMVSTPTLEDNFGPSKGAQEQNEAFHMYILLSELSKKHGKRVVLTHSYFTDTIAFVSCQ